MGERNHGSSAKKAHKKKEGQTPQRSVVKEQLIVGANSWTGKPIGSAVKLFSLLRKFASGTDFMEHIMDISYASIEEISGKMLTRGVVAEDIQRLHNFMQRDERDVARASITWNRPEKGDSLNDQDPIVFADGHPVALGLARIISTIDKMVLRKHGFVMNGELIGVLWGSILARVGALFKNVLYKALLFEVASTPEKLYAPENSLRGILDAEVRMKFRGRKELRFLLNHLDKSSFDLSCVVSNDLKPHLREAIIAADLDLSDGANTIFNRLMEIFFRVRGDFSKKKHLEEFLPEAEITAETGSYPGDDLPGSRIVIDSKERDPMKPREPFSPGDKDRELEEVAK